MALSDRDYREEIRELDSLYEEAEELYKSIDVDNLKNELKELEEQTFKEDFWKDQSRVTEVNQEVSRLKRRIAPWVSLMKDLSDERDLMEMAFSEEDEDILKELSLKLTSLRRRFEELETYELFSGEDDLRNAFLIIHPGAGGTESQDWALMLYRMYLRWAEDRGFSADVLYYSPGEDAGIKDATVLIKGEYAYGLLKCERGIHRLVRISPFDSNKRRHTSFASVDIVPEVPEDIDIEISESDLRIDTYRASGAGGQHVNRTDSAVRITHIPTGIVVQCQNERSQHKNKAFAMKVLKSRIYELRKKELDDKKLEKLGEKKDISWGNQIRSYVYHPYTLVKDHRTGHETGNIDAVLDGELEDFINSCLKYFKENSL